MTSIFHIKTNDHELDVPGSTTLNELAALLCELFENESSLAHLWHFTFGKNAWDNPQYRQSQHVEIFEDENDVKSSNTVLDALSWEVGNTLTFLYDYGTSSTHYLVLKSIENNVDIEGRSYPMVNGVPLAEFLAPEPADEERDNAEDTMDTLFPNTSKIMRSGGLLSLGKGGDPYDIYFFALWTSGLAVGATLRFDDLTELFYCSEKALNDPQSTEEYAAALIAAHNTQRKESDFSRNNCFLFELDDWPEPDFKWKFDAEFPNLNKFLVGTKTRCNHVQFEHGIIKLCSGRMKKGGAIPKVLWVGSKKFTSIQKAFKAADEHLATV